MTKIAQTKVATKLQEVKSPIHGRAYGLRFVAAIMNMAGRDITTGEACPSYAKPYFLFDVATTHDSIEKDYKRFLQALEARHYVI